MPRFVRACAVEMHMDMWHAIKAIWCRNLQEKCRTLGHSFCAWTCHKSHFMRKCAGNMPDAPAAAPVLCEPAQSKCTWTFHKSHFVGIYRGNAVRFDRDIRFVRACAVEIHMDISQEPFYAEIYRELAGHGWYHLKWTPGHSTYRKNPFSVATLFGEKSLGFTSSCSLRNPASFGPFVFQHSEQTLVSTIMWAIQFTLCLFNIAMGNCPFIDSLPIKNAGSFHGELLVITRGYTSPSWNLRDSPNFFKPLPISQRAPAKNGPNSWLVS